MLFVGGGFNLIGQWPYPKFNDLWCYFPEIDQWFQKETLSFPEIKTLDLVGANTTTHGYCFYESELIEYNPIFDLWEKMTDVNVPEINANPYVFVTRNNLFVLDIPDYTNEENVVKLWKYEK